MIKSHELDRLSKIAKLAARRYGAMAGVYIGGKSFDIMTEKWSRDQNGKKQFCGCTWLKLSTRDAYLTPRKVAVEIRQGMKSLWGNA